MTTTYTTGRITFAPGKTAPDGIEKPEAVRDDIHVKLQILSGQWFLMAAARQSLLNQGLHVEGEDECTEAVMQTYSRCARELRQVLEGEEQ